MATFFDPETGVELNVIQKRRSNLDEIEQETARRLRARGEKVQDIAAMLGTNQGRVMAAIGLTGRADGDQGSLF
jgi:hypothetical protein